MENFAFRWRFLVDAARQQNNSMTPMSSGVWLPPLRNLDFCWKSFDYANKWGLALFLLQRIMNPAAAARGGDNKRTPTEKPSCVPRLKKQCMPIQPSTIIFVPWKKLLFLYAIPMNRTGHGMILAWTITASLPCVLQSCKFSQDFQTKCQARI
jgi:hypothetical protein